MATTLPDAVAATGASTTEAQFKTFVQNLRAALAEMGDPLGKFGVIQNLSLVLSVAGNALTIALKDRAGADPTATAPSSPVSVPFRNVTVATGDFSVINVTAASSLVVSSSSTLGTVNSTPFRLWIVGFNDGGTFRLGVINSLLGTSILPLSAWGIASSTAEGGAGAADSAQVFYTGTAVSSKAYTVLGYAAWESGLATAGTWSSGPTRVQLFGPGVPLPNTVVGYNLQKTATRTTSNVAIPVDNTIPQNTEGTQLLTADLAVTSAANVLRARTSFYAQNNTGVGAELVAAIFRDSVANAKTATVGATQQTSGKSCVAFAFSEIAGASGATTYKVRFGPETANGSGWAANGGAANNLFGGVDFATLEVEEVMA